MKVSKLCPIITVCDRYDPKRCFTSKSVNQWNKEECFNIYTDTAGNYHFTGACSGEHTIRKEGRDVAGVTPYTDKSWRKTNADRVRAMTDEELAKFLDCYCVSASWECPRHHEIKCHECWLKWLKEEANNDSTL